MSKKVDKQELATLYKSSEISKLWQESQSLSIIDHPKYGLISPNEYRAKFKDKPCPYCAQKMRHGDEFKTSSRQMAINKNYEYQDKRGKKIINQIGSLFFHPNYVTLDHKLNKARFPEKMFDYDNLQPMCWQCNRQKSDDNSFDLQYTMDYLTTLTNETLKRYPLL